MAVLWLFLLFASSGVALGDHSKGVREEWRWKNWPQLPPAVQAQWISIMTEPAWRMHRVIPGRLQGRNVVEVVFYNLLMGERVAVLAEDRSEISQTQLLAMLWKPYAGQGWVWYGPIPMVAQHPRIGPCDPRQVCIL